MYRNLRDLVQTWAYCPIITPITIVTMVPIINLVVIIQMDRSLQDLPYHLLVDFKFTLLVIIIAEYL